jgi:hypothetical protein
MIAGWKEEIQWDYLNFLRGHPKATLSEFATHLKLSEGCAIYWLTDLVREGKVRITGMELVRARAFPVSGPAPTPPEDY